MATPLSDRFTQRTVELIDDPRQQNQMLAVNNNLQAAANELLRQLEHWKGHVVDTQYTILGPTPSAAFVHCLCITYQSPRQLGLGEGETGR